VLRHEVAVLRRITRRHVSMGGFLITPATILRWHRQLVRLGVRAAAAAARTVASKWGSRRGSEMAKAVGSGERAVLTESRLQGGAG
jgi:hypothetical protein